ncbi:MAG: hypothetical protein HOM37_03975 [Acidimicrobiaceae bacterium]|nr:hypothetical protein [Acidimicrobiaceae bacterium]MDG1411480.1 hypothetical protein [Acidimicrobiales bacterium]MDG2218799.1 hypothetical protein [Acidimicrobiales bacterium]
MLPDWLDPQTLQWAILGVIAVLLYLMYVVARTVRRALTRFLLFILLAGLGLSLWVQRDDLQNCVDTCSCSLYGQDVEIPEDRRPDRCTA